MSPLPPLHLSHHVVDLDDGCCVGVAIAGRGVPLVVVHGFAVESLLYAQPLARLAALGFQVIGIDLPGHGATDGLRPLARLDEFSSVLVRTLDRLGVERFVIAGHSLGGRLAADVAAVIPDRVIGLVLVDAIVGEPWERIRSMLRGVPPAVAVYGGALAFDALATLPLTVDPRQALKIGSRISRSVGLHLARPWRAFTPGQAILRADSSLPVLERIRAAGVYVAVVHGDRDVIVPLSAARDAAQRVDGDLLVVRGGGHSWLLRCPETFPAIIADLLNGRLGVARDGVCACTETFSDGTCVKRDALVTALAERREPRPLPTERRAPTLRWNVESVAA